MNEIAKTLDVMPRAFFKALGVVFAMFICGFQAQAQDTDGSGPPPVRVERPTVIKTVQVQGNQRVEANTVASYLLFARGDPYSDERIDLSVKTLYATGLFADVEIEPRDGNVLIRVIEKCATYYRTLSSIGSVCGERNPEGCTATTKPC